MPVEGSYLRRAWTAVVVMTLAVSLSAPETARAARAEKESPPGQVYVMTVNARQQLAVDMKAFTRLYELVRAIRKRPTAFDGGFDEATGMPDVIIFNEMRDSNLEIVRRLLLQRSKFQYEMVSLPGADDLFLYNATTMTQQGPPQGIADPCRTGGDGQEGPKQYLLARFTENATNAPVTVAGVHFKAKYNETGQPRCRERNVESVKAAVVADVGAVILGGDFNKRPVEVEAACDPNEESPALEWYQIMTNPSDLSRPFEDAVREYHRHRGTSMATEWTFERLNKVTLCTGTHTYKRSRLDYLFSAGATIAEAHADHPGWADEEPGSIEFGKERYSDHRWVWGRFVLTGPPRPHAPTTTIGRDGSVLVTWEPVDTATNYIVYRAKGSSPFSQRAQVPADQVTFEDHGNHGVDYRYAIAPIGPDGGHGRESPGTPAIPDARGPRVTATDPPAGAAGVSPRTRVRVWFDERIADDSVDGDTIELTFDGRRVPGRVIRESARQLSFDPANPLRKGKRYVVTVRVVHDSLGNRGERYRFSFSTPPKRKRGQRD